MRRFTRPINAFSKKIENHSHAVAIHLMFYNFVGMPKTLRATPAMVRELPTSCGNFKMLWGGQNEYKMWGCKVNRLLTY